MSNEVDNTDIYGYPVASEKEKQCDNLEKLIENVVEVGPGNYYGCLCTGTLNGKYYWSVENYDGHDWQEIRESLYKELMKT